MYNIFKKLDARSNKMIVVIILIIVVAIVGAYVYSRNREMFEDANQPLVEYFYMNGCPWCEKFDPEWTKFTEVAKTNGINTKKYEASEASDKLAQYGITGFPSIMITKSGGKPTEYKGDRTSDALVQAVQS
jgi:thiol-disulfide isomerase/thioredoxin